MGVLTDIREKAPLPIGAASMVFWIVAGAGLGALADAFYWGAAGGFCIGLYAAMVDSKVALALSVPGMILGFVATALSQAPHT
jgi:hypothetical protein